MLIVCMLASLNLRYVHATGEEITVKENKAVTEIASARSSISAEECITHDESCGFSFMDSDYAHRGQISFTYNTDYICGAFDELSNLAAFLMQNRLTENFFSLYHKQRQIHDRGLFPAERSHDHNRKYGQRPCIFVGVGCLCV